jgi:hypothetical protein
MEDLRAVVLACIPTSPYWVPRKYRVVTHRQDGRVELQQVVKALGLPDILPISIHPGMAGLKSRLTPGSMVIVQFVDGDPSQPIITHFAAEGDQGFLPLQLALDAELLVELAKSAAITRIADGVPVVQGVARFGDSVQAGIWGGFITSGSTKVSCG